MTELPDSLIYETFPRHVGKIAALRAISKAVKGLSRTVGEELARELIYAATLKYANSPEGRRPDRNFIPHPSTFFNEGRYLDDPKEWGCKEFKAAVPVDRKPEPWVVDYWRGKMGKPEFRACPEDIKELLQ